MSVLKVGFSRVDITPPLGIPIAGYFVKRYADGILDNLDCNCIAVSDGEKTALLYSLDLISINQKTDDIYRKEIAEATGVSFDTVCRDELGTSFDKYFENLREEMGLETMFPKKKDKDAAGKFELIDGNRLYTFGKKGTRADAGGYFEIAVTGDTLTLEKYVGDNGPSFTFPAVMKKI